MSATKEVPTKEAEDSMQRIVALHKVRIEAQEKLEAAESEVKLLRRQVDKAQRMVNEAIQEESTPTLFSAGVKLEAGDLEAARKKLLDADKAEAAATAAAKPVPAGDQSWRQILTESLDGIPGKVVGVLKTWQHNGKHAGLDTLGGLVDWKSADRWFTDVKGVGKAAAEKIDNAIVAYFEKNPIAPAGEPAAAPPATQPAAEAPPAAEPAPAPAEPAAEPEKKKRTRKKAEAK